MKKKVLQSLTVGSAIIFMLAGCGGNKTETKESTKKETKTEASSTDVATGASAQAYTDPKDLQDKYDIVIIGAGGAGMSAAIQAKDAGKNPVILEKMPVAGGNTLKSSSGMNASETKFQKESGISDSNDKFYEETLKGGHDKNDKELLRYYVDNSASAIDWLDSMGIRLNNLTITGGMSEKRTHRPEDGSAVGEYLVHGLLKNVTELNIPIFVNADVTEIKEKDGKISGVKVDMKETKEKKEISSQAVVVATGGYGANPEMIKAEKPELDGYVTTNQEGSTGDGIKMIEKLGGQVVDMNQIQIHPTVQQDTGILIGEAVRGEGGILVSEDGTRFINELDTRDKVSAAINQLKGKAAYLVFDSGVRERVKAIDFYDKQGFVKKGETVADLAKEIGVKEDALDKTVTDWNQAVADKKDAQFERKTGMDKPLDKGPYYAIKIAPGIHYTMGGVKINAKTEVLTKDNKAIPGLYAAGEVTGGLHGTNRIGGNSVGDIIVFGRQAGDQSAQYIK
ncbi:flavocytochrome c [Vagococcus penaei]|uniref:Flavocytochrome c n=1 Tax=Vagococcus penaei TaxID=633807 RepID=A0A1Q2D7G3_9ENTE|nr:flavocytochrome c [Vagococcus penaei]AQP54223.1 flavocytochrome c [Vagococcus penaei]RSU00008.1 flavocytochrome c [Vagococcus penaei]